MQLVAMHRQNELLSAAKRQADQQGQHLRGQLSKVKEVLAERQSLRYELGQVSLAPPLRSPPSSPAASTSWQNSATCAASFASARSATRTCGVWCVFGTAK